MKKLRLWEVKNPIGGHNYCWCENGRSMFTETRVLTWLAEKAALLPRVTKARSIMIGSSVDSSR